MDEVNQIKNLLINGEIGSALAHMLMLSMSDSEFQDTIIILLGQYNEAQRKLAMGCLNNEEGKVLNTQTIKSILFFLDKMALTITDDTKPSIEYSEGRKKLTKHQYKEANDLFEKVPPFDSYYLQTLHNQTIVKYATSTTLRDIEDLFVHMNNLEMLILCKEKIDKDLLEKFLFNRGVILNHLDFIDLAREDFEKLRLLGSELGSEYL